MLYSPRSISLSNSFHFLSLHSLAPFQYQLHVTNLSLYSLCFITISASSDQFLFILTLHHICNGFIRLIAYYTTHYSLYDLYQFFFHYTHLLHLYISFMWLIYPYTHYMPLLYQLHITIYSLHSSCTIPVLASPD